MGTMVLSDDAPVTKSSDFVSDLQGLQEIVISFVIFCTRSGIDCILFLRRTAGKREPSPAQINRINSYVTLNTLLNALLVLSYIGFLNIRSSVDFRLHDVHWA